MSQRLKVATGSTSPYIATVYYVRPYGRFIEINSHLRGKKLHRTNQGFSFLGGSFSNRDNVRASIPCRRERHSYHLKRLFFFNKRPIDFHINSANLLHWSSEIY